MYDIFSIKDFKFPDGFIWGSATAGHQIEGMNIHCQDWARENAPGYTGQKSGMACNHYNLYKEDINLLEELGHQMFRLSVEWARIEPENGCFDEKEVQHYIDELKYIKDKGIKTCVTLVHHTIPQWFELLGEFCNMENMHYFERFVDYIVPKIAEYTDMWIVINEMNLGNTPKQIQYKLNSVRYHAKGYHVIKKYSDAPVSSAHALVYYMPYRTYDEFDNIMVQYRNWQDHEFFFHAIRTGEIVYPFHETVYDESVKGTCDFWSVNCYVRDMIDSRKASGNGERYDHKVLKMIKENFYLEEMYPEGIFSILTKLTDKPVYITENGCSCDDDRFRIVWLTLYLSALSDAIKSGVDVRGYLYWSFLDNYEWGSFLPRFGLVSVDWETFERTVKPSALFYKEIIENNGFSQQILRKYLKEMPSLEV